jgi:hypothetical protein
LAAAFLAGRLAGLLVAGDFLAGMVWWYLLVPLTDPRVAWPSFFGFPPQAPPLGWECGNFSG